MITLPYTIDHKGGLDIINVGAVSSAIDLPFASTAETSFYVVADNKVVDFGTNVLSDTISLVPAASETIFVTGKVPFSPWLGDYTGVGSFTATIGNAPCAAVPEPGAMSLLGAGLLVVALLAKRRAASDRSNHEPT